MMNRARRDQREYAAILGTLLHNPFIGCRVGARGLLFCALVKLLGDLDLIGPGLGLRLSRR